ncbi:MAG: bifunctional demethylmenaquinone methyltransferase/2-methoxy-6-polyprenyl-1,4-benzoquinol methylase UbiE [Myxococcales bacterium]|nr:bifunctional demethylmenaquinone methyltransferase/2-methoxy-6-polyprenyl-1,4-benzoquinol methylase UbiE [Myxococcales bacterium]
MTERDTLHDADVNRAMFDEIADRYDLLNRVLSLGIDRRWRRAAVDALALHPERPIHVLDVATGTGDVAIEIAGRYRAARVTGIDPSQGMLNHAADKVGELELGERVSLRTGSVLELPFEDEAFDGAVVAFGIRNVTDRRRGVAEMARVVRSGARVVVLELSVPRVPIVGSMYRSYFTKVLPAIGGLLSKRAAYTYLPASVIDFPTREAFAAIMEEAGLRGVAWKDLTGGIATVFWGEKP